MVVGFLVLFLSSTKSKQIIIDLIRKWKAFGLLLLLFSFVEKQIMKNGLRLSNKSKKKNTEHKEKQNNIQFSSNVCNKKEKQNSMSFVDDGVVNELSWDFFFFDEKKTFRDMSFDRNTNALTCDLTKRIINLLVIWSAICSIAIFFLLLVNFNLKSVFFSIYFQLCCPRR